LSRFIAQVVSLQRRRSGGSISFRRMLRVQARKKNETQRRGARRLNALV
jgi:hypothetical protein